MRVVTYHNGGQFYMRPASEREEFNGLTDAEWDHYQKGIIEISDEEWESYQNFLVLVSQWSQRCAELNKIAIEARGGDVL